MLSREEIKTVFVNTYLEENYNFLEDDLIKLANAFIDAAKPTIAREERAQCVKIAKSYNILLAEQILEKRAKS